MRYLAQRVLTMLAQLAVLSVVLFLFFRLLPGDVHSVELADPQRSREAVETERAAGGLNRSWAERYYDWASSGLRGDFGKSLQYGLPVRGLLGARVGRTLEIVVPALALAWITGVAGALLAVGLRLRIGLQPAAAAAAMVPDVIAVSVMLWVAVAAGVSVAGAWLPTVALAFALTPVIFLHAFGEISHARELDFVRIAEGRGIPGRRLWVRYVLRAAANPLITLAGLSVAAAVASSFVVEVLTGWPGLGPMFLEAVEARDYPIVQAVLMMLAGVLAISNLAADLALYRLDPRIRLADEG